MKTHEQLINERIESLDEYIVDLENLAWQLYQVHKNDSLADVCYKFWENCDTLSLQFDDITDYFQHEIDKPF